MDNEKGKRTLQKEQETKAGKKEQNHNQVEAYILDSR